jgi:hypothetical protein
VLVVNDVVNVMEAHQPIIIIIIIIIDFSLFLLSCSYLPINPSIFFIVTPSQLSKRVIYKLFFLLNHLYLKLYNYVPRSTTIELLVELNISHKLTRKS